MPTYDYECPKGHRFEVFQRMSDDPVAECPECGAPAQRKISGGAGFLFKGEGFYITDYRSEDYRKKASAESGEPAKTSKPEGSSDGGGKSTADKAAGGSDGGTSKGTPSSDR